jgi:hypothetical protein
MSLIYNLISSHQPISSCINSVSHGSNADGTFDGVSNVLKVTELQELVGKMEYLINFEPDQAQALINLSVYETCVHAFDKPFVVPRLLHQYIFNTEITQGNFKITPQLTTKLEDIKADFINSKQCPLFPVNYHHDLATLIELVYVNLKKGQVLDFPELHQLNQYLMLIHAIEPFSDFKKCKENVQQSLSLYGADLEFDVDTEFDKIWKHLKTDAITLNAKDEEIVIEAHLPLSRFMIMSDSIKTNGGISIASLGAPIQEYYSKILVNVFFHGNFQFISNISMLKEISAFLLLFRFNCHCGKNLAMFEKLIREQFPGAIQFVENHLELMNNIMVECGYYDAYFDFLNQTESFKKDIQKLELTLEQIIKERLALEQNGSRNDDEETRLAQYNTSLAESKLERNNLIKKYATIQKSYYERLIVSLESNEAWASIVASKLTHKKASNQIHLKELGKMFQDSISKLKHVERDVAQFESEAMDMV